MGGIGLQQLFILAFVVLIILFQRRKHFELEPVRSTSWHPLVYTLYVALCLITVRSFPSFLPFLSFLFQKGYCQYNVRKTSSFYNILLILSLPCFQKINRSELFSDSTNLLAVILVLQLPTKPSFTASTQSPCF